MIETEDHPALLTEDWREAVAVVSKNFTTVNVVDFEYEIDDGRPSPGVVYGRVRAE